MNEKPNTPCAGLLRRLLPGLLALLLVDALNRYFFWDTPFAPFDDRPFHASSILNVFLFIGAWMLFSSVRGATRRTRAVSAVYGAVMAGALVLGRGLYLTDRLSSVFVPADRFVSSLVCFVGFTALIAAVCIRLLPLLADTRFPAGPDTPRRSFFPLCWGLIFLAWLPALLAYWPGIHSFDVWWQTPKALGPLTGYTQYHPPLHTMFWALCIRAGGRLGVNPMTLYALAQMLMASAAFAWMLACMRRARINRFLVLAALVYTAFNPALAIFSVAITKDVLFGAFLLLLVLHAISLVRDPGAFLHKPRAAAGFAASAALTMLLRNNAVYMFLLALPFFVLGLRRHAGRTALLFILPLAVYGLVSGPVYDSLGIRKGDEIEALCVPLSQMANVVLNDRDTLTDEELAAIDRYFPVDRIENIYNPRFADYIKHNSDKDAISEDHGAFFRLWLSLLPKHPDSYLCAFLDLNLPYWYPDAASVDFWSGRDYIEVENTEAAAFSTERASKLPWLAAKYDRVADFSAFENRPLLNTLFSIATPIWLLLFTAAVLIWKKRPRLLLPLAFPFFLWATYLAGPVSNFRYVEPLIAMYPLWITMALQPDRWLDDQKGAVSK